MTSRRHVLATLAATFGLILGLSSGPQTSPTLRPDSTVAAELGGGESHHHELEAPAGRLLHLSVEQDAVDVTLLLHDPQDREVLVVDSPNAAYGPEELWLFSDHDRRYRLEIRSAARSRPGRYRLHLAADRDPGENQRRRVRAVTALYQASRDKDPRRALERYREAHEIWRAEGETCQEALALLRIGQTQRKLGLYEDAIETYARALALFEELDDDRMIGRTLRSLGRVYRATGRLDRARDCQRRSLKLARQLADRRAEADSVNSLAILDREEGDTRAALRRYAQALAVYQELDDEVAQATALSSMGRSYNLLGMATEALEVLERALDLARKTGKKRLEAISLVEIGWAFYLQNQPEQAMERYRLAAELCDRPRDRAAVLDRMGTAYRVLGAWEEALASYDQALALLRPTGMQRDVAQTLLNRAELFLDWGRLDESLTAGAEALELFEVSADPHGQAHGLYLQARARAAGGDLRSSREQIEKGLAIVEELRRGLASQALSLPFFDSRQIYHELHVELLMQLHALHPTRGNDVLAFEAAERARARGLLETLSARRSLEQEPDDLRQLRERVNALDWERLRLDDGPRRQSIAEKLDRLVLDLADAEARHRESAAALVSEEPVGVAEIRTRLLDPDTLLLAYSLGEERSFLWAVSSRSVASYELPPRDEIAIRAQRVRELLAKSHGIEIEGQSLLAGKSLARVILDPVAAHLDVRRLLIIGDGDLHSVPFAALPHPRDGRPLVARHEIVRLPSASVLTALRRRAAARPRAAGMLAVLADPVFDPADERLRRTQRRRRTEPASAASSESVAALKRSARDLAVDVFSRLPAASEEAAAILRLVPNEQRLAALGLAANRDLVTTGRLRGYRILHFATHGLLHQRRSDLSGLVLSLVDESGRPRDGFLRAHEIAGLELPAELVVLSACRTALGPNLRAEGLLSLSRSFLNAGASRVVASLWKVDDKATAELMTRFYRGMLEQDLRPAAALRNAQLAMLRAGPFRAPAYWAGFELQGEWR